MDSTVVTVLEIVALLAANAFFVAAEFALVKARGFRLEAMAAERTLGARLAVRIQSNLEAYLAACQLGITMASLGLGWIGEPAVAAVLEPAFGALGLGPNAVHSVSFLVGFVLFSSLHIVIGEQVPKTFAIRQPEPVSALCAYPLHAFYILVFPLNWLLNRASGGLLALFGVQEATHAEVLSSEEIRTIVASSEAHGALEGNQARMLENLFAFDERTVGRVMIPRVDVAVLDLSQPSEVNHRVMAESGHSRFPLLAPHSEWPLGIVLVKEVYRLLLESGEKGWSRVEELAREPLVVPETIRIAPLFQTMREKREHIALVVDEYGAFIGIVALEDLIEEIVGDIQDELDDAETRYPIEQRGAEWEADGLSSLADVERATGLSVPDNLDANTLSGLFLQRLARMPGEGDSVEEAGYRLEVLSLTGHRISKVRIRPPGANPTDSVEGSSGEGAA